MPPRDEYESEAAEQGLSPSHPLYSSCRILTRDQLISSVHGRNTVLWSRTVDVHVTAVRRKLGALGECVQTVRGVGYRFRDPNDLTE